MIQTFTSDDVLRYVYEETNSTENALIEEALMSDSSLLTFFLESVEMKHLMNKIERNPSDRVVANILEYSRNYPNSQPALA
jgi:hypothetical protein